MKEIIDGTLMREADRHTIEEMGIPSLVLMERAALKTVETMEQENVCMEKMLVVCGSGNNGGDGFAVARLLLIKGKSVSAVLVGNPEHCTEETRKQMEIFQNYGGKVETELPEQEFTAVIDAVFGIGLSREVSGKYAEILKKMNSYKAKKIAVDIPSGIHSTTGEVMGTAFQADLTVTFAYAKTGMILYPGASYAGKVVVSDIGIYLGNEKKEQRYVTYERDDVKRLCPKRKEDANKGTYGKVLMITGSNGMSGAAYLSAKAAYQMGAGLVQIYTSLSNRVILQTQLPEAIVSCYDENAEYPLKQLEEKLDWADLICIGCGIGMSETAGELLKITLNYLGRHDKKCVVDADGLNLLSRMERKEKEELLKAAEDSLIITPHVKEFSRILGKTTEETKKNRILLAQQYVENYNIILTAKDARTIVTCKGEIPYLNTTGNSAMAKAGSGDVLAGIITGCLALGMRRFEAASFGVFVHGLCGDEAARKKGSHSVLAEDLIAAVPTVLGGRK